MLPRHPLFRAGDIERVAEAEFVVWIVVAGEVGENGESFLNSEAALIVVHDDRNASIGAQLGIPRLFLDFLRDVDALPGVVLLTQSVLVPLSELFR